MHPCLEIVEILRLVFACVYDDYDGLRDMPALAVTCRTFYDPACDVIWQTLRSLAPLVRCMSADTWQMVDRTVSLRRATTSEDWAPCKRYARRVRHLGFLPVAYGAVVLHPNPATRKHEVDYRVLQVLSLNQAITFPNLQAFAGTADHLPYTGLFLGLSLQSVELWLPPADPNFFVSSVLDSFRTRAPNLKSFCLVNHHRSDVVDLGPVFIGLVEGLACLQVLDCSRYVLPRTAVRALAASSTLHTLKVANTGEDIVSSLPKRQPPFQQLKYLAITTQNFRQCSELFRRMRPRHLHTLDILTTHPPLGSEVHHFFKNTSDASPTPLGASDAHVISPTTITPLLAFRNLEYINIDFHCAFQLDDISFEKMTTAWPKITQFTYGPTFSWDGDGAMSLDGLISIAKHWPHVTSVRLPCNPESTASSCCRPGEGAVCALWCLEVKSLVFDEEPAMVASFLTDIFPKLEEVATRTSICHGTDASSRSKGLWSFIMIPTIEIYTYATGAVTLRAMKDCFGDRGYMVMSRLNTTGIEDTG
ncbi:hypothetical protein FPV67DRAFT_1658408 [Lyophyllum atratum]|nr:hypothetical protein FPV67DRAFT_1658408 [Lyophyllum atratum]